ncbi:hypothetical protein [Azospirillum sp. TSO22-1]|uniref:hypothetical protein n=1 Tax=Azospirillum sp. TSO22-1 TaxID=716789 RepID=UPI000D60833E|nr:hypothetical protein [Azospirillum sp. TSO22-1]PWC54576.1 hypothetical protein TSO221_08005 [Azospirillum sp. TSO22-1]
MLAQPNRLTTLGLVSAALFAISFAHHAPAQAQQAERKLLHEQDGKAYFVDENLNLACTGCRRGVPAGTPVVISKALGPGLSAVASEGKFLILQENRGTSCHAGGWYALHLETLAVKEIKIRSCSEILKDTYTLNKDGSLVVTLTHYDGRKISTKLK